MEHTVRFKIMGDFACFTRPECKGERVSYEVPTPSALRGVVSAIFWKPQISWRIRTIEILKPIQTLRLSTNELKRKSSYRAAMAGRYVQATSPDERTRRHNLLLRDVAYNVTAEVRVRPGCNAHPQKYIDQFNRYLERGACFKQPRMGSKYLAYFDEVDPEDTPIPLTREFGNMFFDFKYNVPGSTVPIPYFYLCRAQDGVIHVPQDPYDYLEDGLVSPPLEVAR